MYMECSSGFCICSKNWADTDGNPFNGCERSAFGSHMTTAQCGVQPPAPVKEIKQVVVDVEFAVETLIPFSTALTQSLSVDAQNAAISVANLFESDLASMSQYGWNFATLDIIFSDPNGAGNRKKRQTAGGAIATIKVLLKDNFSITYMSKNLIFLCRGLRSLCHHVPGANTVLVFEISNFIRRFHFNEEH